MTSNDDPDPSEEEQPPPRAMFYVPRVDVAGDPPVCPHHPEVTPRRMLRARWICPACLLETPA